MGITYAQYRRMTSFEILDAIGKNGRSEWKNGRSKWNYVTTLRGPDSDDIFLKTMFTCFVRGRSEYSLDIIDFESKVVEMYENKEKYFSKRKKKLKLKNVDHWITHMFYVLNVIKELGEELGRITSILSYCLACGFFLEENIDNLYLIIMGNEKKEI